MITAIKILAQDVLSNMNDGQKKINSMYKETLFDMNLEDGDIPADKISTQGIEIFDTKNDTESLSLFEIGLKPQGLYYEYLQICQCKKISRGA